MFEIYNTAELIEVLRVQQGIPTYWLNYFPRVITSDREEIVFDQITDGTRRLAPFVAPNVQGRVLREKGYTTKTFRPAYVKPKHVVDPSRAIPRLAGEAIGGEMSMQERYDAVVAENLRMEKVMIQNRLEWMGCRALVDGSVVVVGEDYPAVTVDFGRDPSLSMVVTGGATTWADPLKDIEDQRRKVNRLASSTITRLTFGLDAWDRFSENPKVQALLDTRYRGSDTVYNTAVPDATPYEFRGIISGQNGIGRLELYTYSAQFEDETGTLTDMLDSNTVVGTGPGIDGVRCFGAIRDKRAGLQALEMFPKMWDVEDPSATYTMTQSAPLMVPAQPNGSFTIKLA
jgi:hypothetical protein